MCETTSIPIEEWPQELKMCGRADSQGRAENEICMSFLTVVLLFQLQSPDLIEDVLAHCRGAGLDDL